ncbi:MAG: YCF48-related protein [Thermoguttaceae bacterium]|nr:YCF48-related protein [Thermoguttaceae bacterium]MDW8037779.1 YCF48-related protein [Thermoguttaceae bacterium]
MRRWIVLVLTVAIWSGFFLDGGVWLGFWQLWPRGLMQVLQTEVLAETSFLLSRWLTESSWGSAPPVATLIPSPRVQPEIPLIPCSIIWGWLLGNSLQPERAEGPLVGVGGEGLVCSCWAWAWDLAADSTKSAGASAMGAAWEGFVQSESVRVDAQLNDVFFLDAQTGWAVGDRGVIWHTEDGGRHWQLQPSGTSARLLSVWFLDRHLGWAVGGLGQPYTGSSTGVVLSTQDGGRSWRPIAKGLLPTLHRIRMVDPQVGFAVGESSGLGPTGVWFTGDGGRSWDPLPGRRSGGWLGGDFFNPATGALVGRWGSVAQVRRAEVRASQTPPLGRRSLWQLELVRPVHGWLVGEGGLLMRSDDAGLSWQIPSRLPPMQLLGQFDLYALAVRGPRVWAAGSPGSKIFYSSDAGQSWEIFSTGQMLPIYGLYFPDDAHGWAVGALGTILATEDGGRSWRRQRSGGVRAALLVIVGQAQRVPWEALAKWAAQEGYLTYVYVVGAPSSPRLPEGFSATSEMLLPDRVHEAVSLLSGAGAQTAWRFPLGPWLVDRQLNHIVARWNDANDGRALQYLQAELVRLLRSWRPEVVLTHDADLQGKDPLGQLVNQAVLRAVELAEDPTAYVDQLTQAGLGVWSVKRIFAFTSPGVEGDFQLPRADLLIRLGTSVAEAADWARSLLSPIPDASSLEGWAAESFGTQRATWQGREAGMGFRLLRSQLPQDGAAPKDLFERILLQPGGEARRMLPELDSETLADLQQQAKRRRHLEAIAQQGVQDARLGPSLLAQTRQWVRHLEPTSAAQLLFHLAQMFINRGQWPHAAELLEVLVELQPEHPTSGMALVWLVQYYASLEAAWRVHGQERRLTPQLATPSWDQKLLEDRWERAAAMARLLEKHHPELFVRPEVRFPLAVADRARGYPKQAERWLFSQRRSQTQDAWWACAQAEYWLDRPEGQPPKPIAFCTLATVKPRLDGRLEEPFWRKTKPILLSAPAVKEVGLRQQSGQELLPSTGSSPQPPPNDSRSGLSTGPTTTANQGQPIVLTAEVRLAYDTQYLYIGIRSPKLPGVDYPASPGPRPRDPDLADHDRVEIFLDLDRDWTTYWHLVVDHRGWAAEACWGDWSWNPQWFVAALADADSWTVEAAIGLDQLTGFFPKANSVWTIGVQRIVPGVGIHTFPQVGDRPLQPSDFGLLIFQ